MEKEHSEIWLEPVCAECGEPDERQWCQDDVWAGACENCGEEVVAVKYVLAPTTPDPEDG